MLIDFLPPLEYKLHENRDFVSFTNSGVLWTELCPPTNSYFEALTSNAMVFDDGDLREVIRVR